jgi:hypothetical protein
MKTTIPIHPVSMAVQADVPASVAKNRRLDIRVLRFNPRQPEVAPHWQSY